MRDWHPNAKRVPITTAPVLTFTGGGRKLVWHTTEGSSAEGAFGAYRNAGVAPHFTIALVNGRRKLYQHIPLSKAASALRHPSGPDTNRANAIQVEIVGFARQSPHWDPQMYHYLRLLALFVNREFGVPMAEHVNWQSPRRLTGAEFFKYSGHIGHMHVPGNDHSDPGAGFREGIILGKRP